MAGTPKQSRLCSKMEPRTRITAAIALGASGFLLCASLQPISANAGDMPVPAPQSGPTLRLQYDGASLADTPLSDFMYFIALISPEPVVSTNSSGTTQRARLSSYTRNEKSKSF